MIVIVQSDIEAIEMLRRQKNAIRLNQFSSLKWGQDEEELQKDLVKEGRNGYSFFRIKS